jgi:4,5-dihydroxyphthalate decarboxylase
MNELRLTLACDGYDRTTLLRTAEVRPRGIDLNYLALPVEETFHRMVKFREFDVAELSLSSYVLTLDAEPRPFVAIPVFPSRSFRHSGIYVNAAAGIRQPSDLVGKRVGIPEYQVTAAVWIRGILADDHGVPIDSVEYRTGGLHTPGRTEKVPLRLPAHIRVSPIREDQTLAEMLAKGEIDALYTPRTPQPFRNGDPRVTRLFPDFATEEAGYFTRTGIFPIMHILAIRRETYEENPWVARSLMDAFEAARLRTLADIDETASLRYMLPWLANEVARTREIMGQDYWRYGADPADPTMETFLRYSHEQCLASRRWSTRELFVPESLDSVVV